MVYILLLKAIGLRSVFYRAGPTWISTPGHYNYNIGPYSLKDVNLSTLIENKPDIWAFCSKTAVKCDNNLSFFHKDILNRWAKSV